MAGSTKTFFAQVFVALALLFFLVALIYWFIALFYTGSNPLGSFSAFAHFALGELLKAVALIVVLVLAGVTYGSVWTRIGRSRSRSKEAAILLAVFSIVLGFVFLGDFVLLAGILLLVAWIILIV